MVLCLLVSIRFQVLFHSPPGVLFTVPSRYFTLSVTWSYLALRDGPRFFRQDSSCPDVLRILARNNCISRTGVSPSPPGFSNTVPLYSHYLLQVLYPVRITTYGLGSSDFARHYFRNRSYFLFLRVMRCFSSPGSPHYTMDSCGDTVALPTVGFPIRKSADRGSFAAPRSLSQLVTSFFGAWCQGIHPMPLLALILYANLIRHIANVLVITQQNILVNR